DDADNILPPAGAGRQQHLPAETVGRLEQQHAMAALGADARRLEPRGAAAYHDDAAPGPVGARDDLRQAALAPRRRIVKPMRAILRLAMGGADAGPDALLLARHQLLDDVWIGDMRARHRHHVEKALAYGVACRRDIGDARRVKDRQLDLALELADALQPGRDGRRHSRHIVDGEPDLRVHPSIDGVEEIDKARTLEALRDLDAFLEPHIAGRLSLID